MNNKGLALKEARPSFAGTRRRFDTTRALRSHKLNLGHLVSPVPLTVFCDSQIANEIRHNLAVIGGGPPILLATGLRPHDGCLEGTCGQAAQGNVVLATWF